MADHAQLAEKQMKRDYDRDLHLEGECPVFTGQKDSKLAAEQIEATFELNSQFMVGCPKPGKPDVTAVKVWEVLPSVHGETLQLSTLVNDDELMSTSAIVNTGAKFTNGHLLHTIVDPAGEPTKSLYSLCETQKLPDELKDVCLGKRSRFQAGLADVGM